MKIRTDFVTNSSSSSFVICKDLLDGDQIKAIHQHVEMMVKVGLMNTPSYEDAWEIEESEHYISGYTWMDNLSIGELFEVIGISDRIIDWDERSPDLSDFEAHYNEPTGNRRHRALGCNWRSLLDED